MSVKTSTVGNSQQQSKRDNRNVTPQSERRNCLGVNIAWWQRSALITPVYRRATAWSAVFRGREETNPFGYFFRYIWQDTYTSPEAHGIYNSLFVLFSAQQKNTAEMTRHIFPYTACDVHEKSIIFFVHVVASWCHIRRLGLVNPVSNFESLQVGVMTMSCEKIRRLQSRFTTSELTMGKVLEDVS